MAKVAFIQSIWYEQLGTATLSAVLKQAGHKVEVFIEPGEKTILQNLSRFTPDIIAFSATTGTHSWALSTARKIKAEMNVPVVMGGPHPTFFPKVVGEEGIDYICRGEGEAAFTELVGALEKGEDPSDIQNLAFKKNGTVAENPLRPLIADLDTVPFPDREIFEKYRFFRKDSTRHFISSRGCPYRCSYCYNEALMEIYRNGGKYLRRRSVANVIDEVHLVKSRHRLGILIFVDDTFCFGEEWVQTFLDRYASELGIPFVVDTRPELVNEKLTKALKKAGCYLVRMGIESGNEKIRTEILGRKISNEQIINGATLIKNAGIKILSYNILGIPGEKVENTFETMDLNYEAKVDFPKFSIFGPYPGTRLGNRAVELGLTAHDGNMKRFSESYLRESILDMEGIGEIVNLYKLFWPAIKLPWLRPLIKRLIKLPHNRFFEWIYLLSMWIQYSRCTKRSFLTTLEMGIRNMPLFLRRPPSED